MKFVARAIVALTFAVPGVAMAVEEPRFTIESKAAAYEIRRYAPVLIAETTVAADFDGAGNQGFRILADYIFGNNRSRATMAMTAPVTQAARQKLAMTAPVSQVQGKDGFLVQFTMPAGFTLAILPEPNDARVHLREIPARRVAVRTYSGSWAQEHYRVELEQLLAALKKDGIQPAGEPVFARFNSPFQLWFLRRNEIWVELNP